MHFINDPVGSTTMVLFQVNHTTRGRCAETIPKTVKAVYANAQVNIDLDKHLVEIESTDV